MNATPSQKPETTAPCAKHDFQHDPSAEIPAHYFNDDVLKDMGSEFEFVAYRCKNCGILNIKEERR